MDEVRALLSLNAHMMDGHCVSPVHVMTGHQNWVSKLGVTIVRRQLRHDGNWTAHVFLKETEFDAKDHSEK